MRGAWCLLATTHALKPALDRRSILGAYASLASLPANAAALRQAELETIQLFEKATKSVVFIDTFAELREKKEMVDEQVTGRCFICGIERFVFDQLSHDVNGFEDHIKNHHNMWKYLFFLVYLCLAERGLTALARSRR